MQALSSLVREHQMISELLKALHSYAGRLRGAAPTDTTDLARFASTFRELVDYRHHEKEESILLPLLARNGFSWSSGSLAEVRREHSHLRYLIDVVDQAAAKEGSWGRDERRKIAESALAFVDFKRRHMQKEDAELLPAVGRRLEARVLERLGVELSQFDEATGKNPETLRVWNTAEELIARYSVGSATIDLRSVEAPESGVVGLSEARYGT